MEAWPATQELGTVGIQPGLVVANLVIPPDQVAPFAQARRNMQVKYLAEIRQRFNTSVLEIPLLPHEVKGLDMLKELGQLVYGQEKIGVR